MRIALIPLLASLAALPCIAADIYRWVDENGKVHISDVVPEKYKGSARRIDGGQAPTAQQRQEAEERAAADRARAKASAATPPAIPAAATLPATPAETECEKAHRLYRESQDCFAPYVNTNGSVRAEAFQNCAAVPDPSPRCGPPKPQ